MQTPEEYRKLAQYYRSRAANAGIRKANVLLNIAKSLAGLASQLELLSVITRDELSQRPSERPAIKVPTETPGS